MKWFHRSNVEDTQPLPPVSQNQIEAMQALNQVRKNQRDAIKRNVSALKAAEELRGRCEDNHFTDSWIKMLRLRANGGH